MGDSATRWEYLNVQPKITFKKDAWIDKLNELGAEGWELVTVVIDAKVGGSAFFKRPIRD